MELARIKRLLVPAAWTLVAAQVLLQVAVVLPLVMGRAVEFDAGLAWLSLLLALVVGLAVGWADAGRQVQPVAAAALVVVVTGTAVLLAVGAISVAIALRSATAPWEVVAQVLLVVGVLLVPVLALLALVRLLFHTIATKAGAPAASPVASELEAPAGRAPVWQPDRAAGAAWHTAGAAATGEAATDWGRPGERGGWAAAGRPGRESPSRPALSGAPSPARAEGASPRPPIDFGPRSQPADDPDRREDPDATRVAPDTSASQGTAAATGSAVNAGPEAIARRYAENDEDLTRSATPRARRPPPRWTPLEDPTVPPPRQ